MPGAFAVEPEPIVGGPLHGRIDDVRIYNRALSDAEIKTLLEEDPVE